jgi:hypothetical protein
LAEFLQRLKVKEKVTGGEFDFDVSLACECAPWNMNYQDIPIRIQFFHAKTDQVAE